jgi:hypothetical protein
MYIDGTLVPIVLFISMGVTTIGVSFAKAYGRRRDHEPLQRSMPADLTTRLERMEQAIDSIAIEVERISEGQRFTTKLFAERQGSLPPTDTPG